MNTESERHDYSPIQAYWFYSKKLQGRVTWTPFSLIDVQRIDEAYAQSNNILIDHSSAFLIPYTSQIDRERILQMETRGTVPRHPARLRYIAWTCMERVFFHLNL